LAGGLEKNILLDNRMLRKILTVIIPFINEREEVENTIESILSHSDKDVEIILINDASDDKFNYQSVAEKYHVTYILNKKREGVAASRDLGVQLCKTDYFLLLDAHMRFYDNLWVQRVITELENSSKTLLCCQTKSLNIKEGILVEKTDRKTSYGACVDFENGKYFLEPQWIFQVEENTNQLQTIPIPCVLGAGYACSKEYWLYLKGLNGLIYYGNDEPYISMKVWMEGGRCKLLKDVVIGHIYRKKAPYIMNINHRLYNRLFIAELLLPQKLKRRIFSQTKSLYNDSFQEVLFLLYKKYDQIVSLKEYYKNIFIRDFSFYKNLNKKINIPENVDEDTNEILRNIANNLITNIQPNNDVGILNGKIGAILFLFHYSKYSNINTYKEIAEIFLEYLLKNIDASQSVCFISGLTGIGWGIEYLYQNQFIEGDTNEILEEFDKKIMEINPLRIYDLSQNYGLGGIILYLLSRLYTIKKEKKENPFDEEYLKNIYTRVKGIIDGRNNQCDSIDIFIEFVLFYEKKKEINKPDVYDTTSLLYPNNLRIKDISSGLRGSAGLGLKLIFDNMDK
jgi:glycosyltransferase involved in cell wall biosynthesis